MSVACKYRVFKNRYQGILHVTRQTSVWALPTMTTDLEQLLTVGHKVQHENYSCICTGLANSTCSAAMCLCSACTWLTSHTFRAFTRQLQHDETTCLDYCRALTIYWLHSVTDTWPDHNRYIYSPIQPHTTPCTHKFKYGQGGFELTSREHTFIILILHSWYIWAERSHSSLSHCIHAHRSVGADTYNYIHKYTIFSEIPYIPGACDGMLVSRWSFIHSKVPLA